MKTSANLPKTGYTTDSPKHFLADAGVWVRDFSYDSETKQFTYALIGATSGGSKITLKYNYRQVEVDGVFTTPVGADMIESAEGTAELTLIEFSKETLKTLILAEVKDDVEGIPDGYEVLSPKGKITKDDYVENLAFIGTLVGSNDPVIIIFHHAFCTSGLEFEPQDKNEAKYTATYELRAGEGDFANMAMPATIWYPTLEAEPTP